MTQLDDDVMVVRAKIYELENIRIQAKQFLDNYSRVKQPTFMDNIMNSLDEDTKRQLNDITKNQKVIPVDTASALNLGDETSILNWIYESD